jgi:hypothetical protein
MQWGWAGIRARTGVSRVSGELMLEVGGRRLLEKADR